MADCDVNIARAYDDTGNLSGALILVDGIWPRGVSKKDLAADDWIKEVAPSDNLRKWFDHDPDKWEEFRKRYLKELEKNEDAVERCLDWCREGKVTLLYGAKDREHNQAVVLRDHLCKRLEQEE